MSRRATESTSRPIPRAIVLTGAPVFVDGDLAVRNTKQQRNRESTKRGEFGSESEIFEPRVFEFLKGCPKFVDHARSGGQTRSRRSITSPLSSSIHLPTWRVLRPVTDQLHTGLSQKNWLLQRPVGERSRQSNRSSLDGSQARHGRSPHSPQSAQMSFLSTSSQFSSQSLHSSIIAEMENENGEERLSDYLDESFALYESTSEIEIPSSKDKPTGSAHVKNTDRSTEGPPWPYTSLAELPHPSKVPASRSGNSKAPLVSMIAVVISVLGPKEVTIRRTGKKAHLYELLVGDETTAGFGITIWHSDFARASTGAYPRTRQQANRSVRIDFVDSPGDLKRGNVIELVNIALTKFRDRVYGQSQGAFRDSSLMRTHIYRAGTASSGPGKTEKALNRRMKEKMIALRDWWRDFSALEDAGESSRGKRKRIDEDSRDSSDGHGDKKGRWLPPDESMIDE